MVYGVRRDRGSDSWFKRTTAEVYYLLLARLGVDVVFNHADYRLMGRRAIAALRQYGHSASATNSASVKDGSDSGTYRPPPGAIPRTTTWLKVGREVSRPRLSM